MDESDRDRADLDDVARGVQREIGVGTAGDAFDTPCFVGLHVQLRGDAGKREELGDTGDRPAAEVAAHMIGVVVRDEDAGQLHVVRGQHVDELGRSVRGIDRDRLARFAVADEVYEVGHLARDLIVVGEVASREELAKVQAVLHRASP